MVSVDFVLEGELRLKVGLQLDGPILILFWQPRFTRGDQSRVSLRAYWSSGCSAFLDTTVPRLCWVAGYSPWLILIDSICWVRRYGNQSSCCKSHGWGEGGVPLLVRRECEGRLEALGCLATCAICSDVTRGAQVWLSRA